MSDDERAGMAVACDKCGAREVPTNTHPCNLTCPGQMGPFTTSFNCKSCAPNKRAEWIMTLIKKDETTDAPAGKNADADVGADASASEEDVSEDEGAFQKHFDVLIEALVATKEEHTVQRKAFLQSVRSATEDPHVPFPDEGARAFARAAIAYEDAQDVVDQKVFRRHVRRTAQTAAQAAAGSTALPRSKKRART